MDVEDTSAFFLWLLALSADLGLLSRVPCPHTGQLSEPLLFTAPQSLQAHVSDGTEDPNSVPSFCGPKLHTRHISFQLLLKDLHPLQAHVSEGSDTVAVSIALRCRRREIPSPKSHEYQGLLRGGWYHGQMHRLSVAGLHLLLACPEAHWMHARSESIQRSQHCSCCIHMQNMDLA